jgi:CHAD domain-containing protein
MKKLTKYLKKRKTTIDFLLRIPQNKYTPNIFHKLRVEIKKLNSFFDLINFCSANFKRKATYKPFKTIFRQAGKVRELQIEDAMIKNYFGKKVVKEYRENLKILRSKAKNDFFLLLNRKLLSQLNKKYRLIIPNLYDINPKKIDTYFEKKGNQIQELLGQESIQKEQIHELRKQLKILNYNKAILVKEKPEKKLLQIDVLPELLGKWHDCQVIIEHLQNMQSKRQISPTEFDQIKIIKPKIVSECKILFNEIKILIPNIGLLEKNN